ncbi:MAG: glycosyltransferase family 2 protein [Gloeobacteraceae cyanobacterium ES-bin-316]|nr:glycosyltransferase family 2 protein [Ferruginibacter sp.]
MTCGPLVSILCISMNHEKYIEKSFLSVVNQTYCSIEILYLDNCSSDASFRIANEIFRNSGLSYQGFVRQTGFGISENVNFLVKKAKGKYITILSADDWWDNSNLKEKIAFYEKHQQYGLLHGAGNICYYNTGKIVLEEVMSSKSGWLLKQVIRRNFVNTIGVIIKKEVLDDVGLFDEKSNLEDWDMWIRIAEKYPIGFFAKPLVYYGKQPTNISANKAYMAKGYNYIFEKYGHYKEIQAAKNYYTMVDIYEAASLYPNLKNLKQLLAHFRFSLFHAKQIAKLLLGLFGIHLKKPMTGKK